MSGAHRDCIVGWIVLVAALSGFVAVGIGAMGSHGLGTRLEKAGFGPQQIEKKKEQCEIGVRYQMYHALAMLCVGATIMGRARLARWACFAFLIGTVLFSGGLYSMSFLDKPGHWSIVPIGGVIQLTGWLLLALSAFFRSEGIPVARFSESGSLESKT
jgi:uncharacterized membrane protein YgdD (TMEM256/DUF423 family)